MKNFWHTTANRYTKPFATITKLSLGLFVICFIAYTEFFAQTADEELRSQRKTERMSSVSMINGTYHVDTAVIWSDRNKNELLDDLGTEDLLEKKTEAEIPGFIRAFLDSISPSKRFNMVNPDEAWCTGDIKDFVFTGGYEPGKQDATCLLSCSKRDASDKQLIYFGMGKNIALLSYYVGGAKLSQCTALIRFKDKTVTDFWFNNYVKLSLTKEEIIKSIGRNGNC